MGGVKDPALRHHAYGSTIFNTLAKCRAILEGPREETWRNSGDATLNERKSGGPVLISKQLRLNFMLGWRKLVIACLRPEIAAC